MVPQGQDKVCSQYKQEFKKDGYFLEFGSQEPITANNTYLLESEYGWNGAMFEWENKYAPKYEQYRDDDTSYIIDAESMITQSFLVSVFLRLLTIFKIDLEPGMLTPLQLLIKLNEQVMDDHKFATITFEHDIYCGQPNSEHNVGESLEWLATLSSSCSKGADRI